ncbi:MAG: LysM peptidoglycan-binding domain-containing protein [Candidatus Aminicenantes bacterium]|nr:LysM peptidoglycan-binding domain-containing protein [Candidatus Aminicenantes bacterium]
MERNIRYIGIFLVAVLIAGGCSSGKRTAKTVPVEPAPVAAAQTEPQTQTTPAESPPYPLPIVVTDALNGVPEEEKNDEQGREEAASLLEEALMSYQDGQSALERGDLDGALAKLDEAYAAILRIKLPPDSQLVEEKNDLRILIAQRIQQAYANRLPAPGRLNGSIPMVDNQWVQKEIKSFQTVERKAFEDAYIRSGLYRTMILDEMRKAGLPEQLSWLPIIESGFKVRALSRARALGLWQFMRSTGYRYGLKQDKYVDERMDPVKATQAAIKYLIELHDLFGDWTTALASYNCGEFRVQNVIRAQRIDYFDNFWDLFQNLPYETARFVPRLIASLHILEDPARYGFELPEPEKPLQFETVAVNQPVKLSVLSTSLGLDPFMLSYLNPELRNESTPNYEYQLKVPVGYGEKVLAAVPSVPRWIPPDVIFSWHYVRNGDTLGMIARRYRTTVGAIQRLNNMRGTLIYPGRRIKIPGRGGVADRSQAGGSAASPKPAPSENASPAETIAYTVKPGDTLFSLARAFNTTVERIKSDNGLPDDQLNAGQQLVIKAGKLPF